jgi:hypothetical protein
MNFAHRGLKMYHARFALSFVLSIAPLAAFQAPASAQGGRFTLQVAAVETEPQAAEQVARLKAQGLDAYFVRSVLPGRGEVYRVRVGRYASREAARAAGERLLGQGLVNDFFPAPYLAPTQPTAQLKQPPVDKTPSAAAPAVAAPRPDAHASRPGRTPSNAATHAPKPAPPAAGPPLPPGFRRYEDAEHGYSFAYPEHWTGGPLQRGDAAAQLRAARPQMDAAANFSSAADLAFVNAIWNAQPGANNPQLDNSLLVGLILKAMGASPGVRDLRETARREVAAGGEVRTYLELSARIGPAEAAAVRR